MEENIEGRGKHAASRALHVQASTNPISCITTSSLYDLIPRY